MEQVVKLLQSIHQRLDEIEGSLEILNNKANAPVHLEIKMGMLSDQLAKLLELPALKSATEDRMPMAGAGEVPVENATN